MMSTNIEAYHAILSAVQAAHYKIGHFDMASYEKGAKRRQWSGYSILRAPEVW